ncbi:cyclin-K-like isoform X2 [Saccostrea cucullata]|uniref:cyclin-K-like isoform X2 n=1 Tax=Saccostrea cuccullata TaxID=36930 RepID=UPI002ED5BA81
MPCWYFEKKELKNTPSIQDGLDYATEARYRREGARFIIDAGTKMGLRYDTCATGVVYFHRFYMFHSFKEFHRYITAACCLFLAGKVEETPKKCKDIIKVCQSLLSPQLFTVFGEDPKEEVMTMERILLQTIKFDLQVEHPYSILLKFAKVLKGDKEKIQKLVQMAWTFINDSLCTCLCLLWEAEIISVSLMYLATRLTKFDIQDWHGRVPGTRTKWWEFLVEDITVDLMEDICHGVLHLYSSNPQSQLREDSPPTTPVKKSEVRDTPPPPPPNKRSSNSLPLDGPPEKAIKKERKQDSHHSSSSDSRPTKHSSSSSKHTPSSDSGHSLSKTPTTSVPQPPLSGAPPNSKLEFSTYNPYMSSHMYSSSFMSQEGSKSIQSLMGGGGGAAKSAPVPENYPPPQSSVAPPPAPGGQFPPPASQYPPSQYSQPSVYAPPASAPYNQPPPTGAGNAYTVPPHGAYPPPAPATTAPAQSYSVPITNPQNYPPGSYPPNYQPPPYQYNNQPQAPPPQTGGYQQNMGYNPPAQPPAPQQYPQPPVLTPRIPMSGAPAPPRMPSQPSQPRNPNPGNSGGLTVRISGRR